AGRVGAAPARARPAARWGAGGNLALGLETSLFWAGLHAPETVLGMRLLACAIVLPVLYRALGDPGQGWTGDVPRRAFFALLGAARRALTSSVTPGSPWRTRATIAARSSTCCAPAPSWSSARRTGGGKSGASGASSTDPSRPPRRGSGRRRPSSTGSGWDGSA